MVNVKQDAELMTNLIAANPVPAGNRFVAIKDENAVPAVISLSSDSELELIITDRGKPTLVNLGTLCGINSSIQAFDAKQDADLKVWIAIASDKGDGKSQMHLVIGLMPSQLLSPPLSQVIPGETAFPQVHGIYMSEFTRTIAGKQFPLVFVGFQPLDRITKEDQLGFLVINEIQGGAVSISLDTQWKLATNPLKIIDVAFIHSPLGDGAAVLYNSPTGRKIQYRTFGGKNNFSAEPYCPPEATCLSSYIDATTNNSVLLVGGQGVSQYVLSQYAAPNAKGKQIIAAEPNITLKDIHNALLQDKVTIWYTTSNDGALYYEASLNAIDQGDQVRLLADGQGGRISGLISSQTGDETVVVNTLVSVDEKGMLLVLQQASDTGMWETHPFYVPSSTDNISVSSFTIRIKAITDATTQDQTLKPAKLFLNSSGATQVYVNGVSTILTQVGTWYNTDSNGVLNLVISTADMSCHTMHVLKYMSSLGVMEELNVQVLNPSAKVNAKLMDFDNSGDPNLLKAKTQSGKDLIEPGTVSQEDADKAQSMLKQLNATQIKMGLLETSVTKTARCHSFAGLSNNVTLVNVVGSLPKDPEIRARMTNLGSSSSPWDFFYYLYHKAKDVANWVLQKVDDFYHLVIDWAGKTFRFLLDTVAAVGKAMSWVFNKIKVAIEKVIDFIGFLFAWGDILDTSDSIYALMNAGLEYSQDQIADVEKNASLWIQSLKAQAKNKKQVKNIQTSSNTKDDDNPANANDVQHSVAYNWSAEQMNHGGFTTSSSIMDSQGELHSIKAEDGDPLQGIWDDLKDEIQKANDTISKIGDSIKALFTPSTDTNSIFEELKDTLVDFALDTLGNTLDILLKGIRLALKKFMELGNYNIEVPIFTALWKLISGGRTFTVFNCFSLILAVPATVIFKAISNVAPPKLGGRLTKDEFALYVKGTAISDASLATDIAIISGLTATSASFIGLGLALITMVIDSAGGMRFAGRLTDSKDTGRMPPFVGVPPAAGNAIDIATMFFDIIGLIAGWPLKYEHDQDLRWWIWGLDCSNAAVLAISRFVGWYANIPRVTTKRFVGVYEAISSIPTYILQIIVDVHEFDLPVEDPEKDDALTTRHVVEETCGLVGAWAFGVAALADEVQDEVTAVALVVMGLALTIKSAFKFVDFVVWYQKTKALERRRDGMLLTIEDSDGTTETQHISPFEGVKPLMITNGAKMNGATTNGSITDGLSLVNGSAVNAPIAMKKGIKVQ